MQCRLSRAPAPTFRLGSEPLRTERSSFHGESGRPWPSAAGRSGRDPSLFMWCCIWHFSGRRWANRSGPPWPCCRTLHDIYPREWPCRSWNPSCNQQTNYLHLLKQRLLQWRIGWIWNASGEDVIVYICSTKSNLKARFLQLSTKWKLPLNL